LLPHAGAIEGALEDREQLLLDVCVVDKAATGTGVDDPDPLIDDAESSASDIFVTADDDHRPGTHVLLLTHDLRDAAASSGRSLLRPAIAVPKTSVIATLRNELATYGRSFTYWSSAPPSPEGPRRPRTRPTGSTSSKSAAVHALSEASG
jgi:hypothetical protein